MVHQLKNVQETSKLGWKDHQIRHTRVWSLDKPPSQQVMCTVSRKWQTENLVFFADGTSCISLLLPIILRSEVHEVEWISIRIFQWPKVLYCCHLWCGLKHFVDCMKSIGSTLKVGNIVWKNGPWFPSKCIETSQGSKKCFCS